MSEIRLSLDFGHSTKARFLNVSISDRFQKSGKNLWILDTCNLFQTVVSQPLPRLHKFVSEIQTTKSPVFGHLQIMDIRISVTYCAVGVQNLTLSIFTTPRFNLVVQMSGFQTFGTS